MQLHVPPALKHHCFFYLWLGLLISVAGSQMQIWAIFWHICELTDQPIALGGIGAARNWLISRQDWRCNSSDGL
jgi:hypothetical protein